MFMSRRYPALLLFVLACDPEADDLAALEAEENASSPVLEDMEWRAPGDPLGMLPQVGPDGLELPQPPPLKAIKAPLSAAYCTVKVNGVAKAMETDYLPHVIQCENGGAGFEALKAQAIAARSVAYYAMANDGKICDGQGCQVYSCGKTPTKLYKDAVAATSGQYLSYNGWLTYAFFVAGDSKTVGPKCVDTSNTTTSTTEKWVTFNNGKSNFDVTQTKLGFVFPEDKKVAGYGQNRGCMSQWGARCQENSLKRTSTQILKFYYGADIQIRQAKGTCVKPLATLTDDDALRDEWTSQPAVGEDSAEARAGVVNDGDEDALAGGVEPDDGALALGSEDPLGG